MPLTDVLQTLIAYPVVLWTMPLGVLGAYWLLVLIGALDVAFHPHVDADVHFELGGDGHHDLDVDHLPFLAELGSFFGLGKAPVVVVLSLFVFAGWATSLLGYAAVASTLGAPGLLVGTALLAAAFVAGTVSARTGAGLLAPIFEHVPSVRALDVIGQECVVVTGRADHAFGQADLYSQGSALRVEIRCDRAEPLRQGERVLVAYYDEARAAYVVEPLPALPAFSSGSEPR